MGGCAGRLVCPECGVGKDDFENDCIVSTMSLTAKILTGMVGLLTGLLFQWLSLPPENFSNLSVDGLFDAVGQIFIVSLKMLVVPLVFVSLTCGAASLGATGSITIKLGSKAIGLYLLTTAIAVTMALSVSLIIDPGMDEGSVLEAPDYQGKEPPGIKETHQYFP